MFKNIATLALCVLSLISTTGAANVDCKVNGDVVATVDLDTGSCPFTLPPSLPALFNFNSEEDYDIEFYYAFVTKKYFTDIIDAGDVITIPAILLIEIGDIPLFNVHVEKLPTSNSTAALQKRLFKNVDILKRATPSPAFIASLESIDGTPVGGSSPFVLSVSLSNSTSSSASPTHASSTELTSAADTGTVTVSTFATTVITITSCSDHKCTKTTVPASEYLTTETVSGKVTTYTTYCPLFYFHLHDIVKS